MSPEEFTHQEDTKAIRRAKEKLADALDGEEVMIAMTALYSMLVFLVETHCVDQVKTYKRMITSMLEAAKKHKEKK